jgi:hypothetical protein
MGFNSAFKRLSSYCFIPRKYVLFPMNRRVVKPELFQTFWRKEHDTDLQFVGHSPCIFFTALTEVKIL